MFNYTRVFAKKVLLLCSVMSSVPVPQKDCLEKLTTLGTAVCCEGCIIEHNQAVPHSVCAERSFSTTSTGQDIHVFMSNIVVHKCDLKIIYRGTWLY
jgi:hypothetical protein